jgi:proteasome assembly chaperone (PAC2) family protein
MNDNFRVLYNPPLESAMFVVGLPGLADAGRIAAQLLTDFVNARLFAEYHSSCFPDNVVIEDSGICRLPRYEFYESCSCQPNIVVLTGDATIAEEDPKAHYEVFNQTVDLALKLKSRCIVVLDGIRPIAEEKNVVYGAANKRSLAHKLESAGAKLFKKNQLPGYSGMILGLSSLRGIDGVGILCTTVSLMPDRDAALNIFKFLIKTFDVKQVKA